MPLINCEINLILTWSDNCVIFSATRKTKFKITDTKFYIPVVTLSIQDNTKLLNQLKPSFKRSINWNKYQTKVLTEGQNQYLDFLIEPSFQGVNRRFVLSFENEDDRKVHTRYYLPKVELKDYNVMIDGKNFFDQLVENNIQKYDTIRNFSTGQWDDYITGFLPDNNYFKENYKMKPIYLNSDSQLQKNWYYFLHFSSMNGL